MKMKTTAVIALLLASSLGLNGCHYMSNRQADLMDIFQLGVGLTTENPKEGIIPPSLGVYVQATEFLNLGAIHFRGTTAELDGRGAFFGPERRTRFGFFHHQVLQISQDYLQGSENYFKKSDGLWTYRMNTKDMRWWNKPAKELDYEFWASKRRRGNPIMHRGYQYWENFNAEIGISEPFITHFGINLKLGFDPSEVFDFLLGITTFDFKHDDMTGEEFDEYRGGIRQPDYKPASRPVAQEEVEVVMEIEEPPPPAVVEPIPADEPFVLHEVVYFDKDSSALKPSEVTKLVRVSDVLREHADVVVYIKGHASSEASEAYNLRLSDRRADAVKAQLATLGIDPGRIETLAYGETKPIETNDNEEGRMRNRRVEIDASD